MTDTLRLTKKQACRFMLLKHGLTGEYKFNGRQGVLDFIKQAGCIQFDPIDVCGKNTELVLQSRVSGFTKQMLYDLLYKDRLLIDCFDKNLAVMHTEDRKYFSRFREQNKINGRSHAEVNAVCDKIKQIIREKGPVCSAGLDFKETVNWYWSDTKLSRAALETMYFRGDLAVHHKKGSVKYYDLAENCIPAEILNEPDPHPGNDDYLKWQVHRRIGSVGLLRNKPSDAWLNIGSFKAPERSNIFSQLLSENKITELTAEGMKDKLYCQSEDIELIRCIQQNPELKERCEFLAPLDNMLWDRKLISLLFGFEYKWEIYTPEAERKYGYYTLPILYGDRFIGRIEAVSSRKIRQLTVKNIWIENGVKPTKKLKSAFEHCISRFADFNECESVYPGTDDIYRKEGNKYD